MSTQPRRLSRLILSSVTTFLVAGALALIGAGTARADDPPVTGLSAAPIQATTKQGQTVSITLQGSGPAGDQLYYSVGSGLGPFATAHGSVSTDFFPSTHALYTPAPGFSGTDTFTYSVQDNLLFGQSASATVTVTVTPVSPDNHAPTAIPITVSVENPPVDGFPATGTDPDGDPIVFAIASPPSHGTVQIGNDLSGATFFYYQPTGTYVGPDSFTFTASDGVLTSAPATASITVVPQRANTPPTSVPPPTVTTVQDTPVAITLTATDADGDPVFIDTYNDTQHGTLSGGEDGHLTYTPKLGYTGPDSFHYEVTDHRSTSDTYLVNIIVTPAVVASHTPTVKPFSVATQSVPVAVTLLGTDPDGDPLTYSTANGPSHGTLSGTGANLIYTPKVGFSGTDGFTYTASDGTNVSSPAAVSITVSPAGVPSSFPTVDVSVSSDLKQAAGKISSPKLTTSAAERLLVAFVTVDGPTAATQKVTAVTGGGLTWSLVTRSNSTWGSAEVWQAHATAKLTSAVVTATFAKSGFDASITVAAFSGAAAAVGNSAAGSGTTGAPSVTVAPRSDGSLIWATGHDWTHAANPVPAGTGSQVIQHKFLDKRVDDSFWVESLDGATTNVPIAIGASSPATDRWQLVGVEIPAAATVVLPG